MPHDMSLLLQCQLGDEIDEVKADDDVEVAGIGVPVVMGTERLRTAGPAILVLSETVVLLFVTTA